MNKKSITFTLLMGLLTSVTLAGSIIAMFVLFGPRGLINPGLVFKPIGSILFLIFPPIGGALWGWGIASLMKSEVKPLIKTGAVTWTIWMFLANFVTGMLALYDMTDLPLNTHYDYLVIFLSAAGIAAAIPACVMTGKLRLDNLKKNWH